MNDKLTFARCPFCGGTEFRVTTREMLEELYERKGAGAMSHEVLQLDKILRMK